MAPESSARARRDGTLSDPQIVQYDGHAWVRLGEYQAIEAQVATLTATALASARDLLELARSILSETKFKRSPARRIMTALEALRSAPAPVGAPCADPTVQWNLDWRLEAEAHAAALEQARHADTARALEYAQAKRGAAEAALATARELLETASEPADVAQWTRERDDWLSSTPVTAPCAGCDEARDRANQVALCFQTEKLALLQAIDAAVVELEPARYYTEDVPAGDAIGRALSALRAARSKP